MTPESLEATLLRWFGYDQFRPGQLEIIQPVLEGREVLALLPTGGGKSLCYQIPALVLPGTTIVISPLIALMKDQVDALVKRGIAATYINSSLDHQQQQLRLAKLVQGKYQLVYISPERLALTGFQQLLHQLDIPLVVIDEAHCISEWGHDFRPEYRQISQGISSLPTRPRILALTATATPQVQSDIVVALQLRRPLVKTSSFFRDNLRPLVIRVQNPLDHHTLLWWLVKKHWGQAILIYCAARQRTEVVAHELGQAVGAQAVQAYHAGLSTARRSELQEAYLKNQISCMVATTAFGMGVDKPDIRCVIHEQLPLSVAGYYQEIGRAGRDGRPAHTYLLDSSSNHQVAQEMVMPDQRRTQHLAEVFQYLTITSCRWQWLRQYFGESLHSSQICGHCSNCQPVTLTLDTETKEYLQTLQQKITHPRLLSPYQQLWCAIWQVQTPEAWQRVPGLTDHWLAQMGWGQAAHKPLLAERASASAARNSS